MDEFIEGERVDKCEYKEGRGGQRSVKDRFYGR